MKVVLLGKSMISSLNLPKDVRGQYKIEESNGKDYQKREIPIEAQDGRWVIRNNEQVRVTDISGKADMMETSIELLNNSLYEVTFSENLEKSLLFVEPEGNGTKEFTQYAIPEDGKIVIGTERNCDIVYDNTWLKGKMRVSIQYKGQEIIVRDEISGMPEKLGNIYLNEKYVENAVASYGDILYIFGLKIILGKKFISVNRPGNLVNFHLTSFKYKNEKVKTAFYLEEEEFFSSSPKDNRKIKVEEISVEKPPRPVSGDETPLYLTVGPALTMASASAVTGAYSIMNTLQNHGDMMQTMPSLVMIGSVMLGSLVWPLFSRRHSKRKNLRKDAENYERYEERIASKRKQVEDLINQQTETLKANYPTLVQCENRICGRESSLWDRSIEDPDFLEISIGNGTDRLYCDIKYPSEEIFEAPAKITELLTAFQNEEKLLRDVPIRYSLSKHRITGITGKRAEVKKFIKGMLVQLAALHSYDDLKIGIIYDQNEPEWECVKWMPHTWSNDKMIKFMADTQDELKVLSSHLELVASMRAEMSEDELKYEKPHYVLFIASQQLAEKSEYIKELYKQRKSANISLVLLYDEKRKLPKSCKHLINVSEQGVKVLDYTDDEDKEKNADNSMFLSRDPEEIFKSLANIKLDVVAGKSSLPENLTLFEMLDIGKPEHFDFMNNWKKSNPTKTLAVPIGVDSDGNNVYLDIHEKAHGPHGLIAGSTGSGKSEFIISYITMMALNFSPEEVGFILIDFKGGGMADVFKNLPHLSGTITNLDGNELNRSLIAIEAELEKRQLLFKETSNEQKISNLDIYRYQQLYREGKVKNPLPHLIIISDEFAELKQQHEEFLEQLIRTARIGRSLGVHLILATQKPDGVVNDQIKSNIKFKVCLRVQDKADSISMLDRPEAAAIRVPGRFYLKVGMNEVFELGQSPFSGAAYEEAETTVKHVDDAIIVFNGLERIAAKPSGSKKGLTDQKQIDALLAFMSQVCDQNALKGKLLWRAQLPGPKRRAEKTYSDEQKPFVLNPVIGQYDDLRRRSYYPLAIPLTSEGNALVYGVAGSGTLEFCNTMIYYMLNQHSPEELQLYLLDYEAGSLRAFEKAPQVAGVFQGYQEKEIDLMLDDIEYQLEGRKKLFSRYGGSYQNYIANSGKTLPNIVIFILNSAVAFESDESYDRMQKIIHLSREGIQYGLYFVMTASDERSVRSQLSSNFRQIYVLQQNKEDAYRDLLGKTDGMIPADFLGRGLFKRGQNCYEFQTTIMFEDEKEPFKKFEEFSIAMNKKYQGEDSVVEVSEEEEQSEQIDFTEDWENKSCTSIPIGISVEDKKVCWDITKQTRHFMVYDSEESKKDVDRIIENVKKICNDVEVWTTPELLLDTGAEGLEEYNQKINALVEEVISRGQKGVAALQKGEEIPDFPTKVVVIDSYERLVHCISNDAYYKLKDLFKSVSVRYHIYFVIVSSLDEMRDGIGTTIWDYPVQSGVFCGRLNQASEIFTSAEYDKRIKGEPGVQLTQDNYTNIIRDIERSEYCG